MNLGCYLSLGKTAGTSSLPLLFEVAKQPKGTRAASEAVVLECHIPITWELGTVSFFVSFSYSIIIVLNNEMAIFKFFTLK